MNYPVISIKPNETMIYGFKDEKSLKIANRKLVKSGIFNDVLIYDSNGFIYQVKKVMELGWATTFLGYSLTKGGQSIKIEFELIPKGAISLNDFKKEITEKVKQNEYFVKTFDQSELETGIYNSINFIDIISFFC